MENFKVGEKVVVYGTGEIEGMSIDPWTKRLMYSVVYRSESGMHLGSATVPADLIEKDEVFHRVAS